MCIACERLDPLTLHLLEHNNKLSTPTPLFLIMTKETPTLKPGTISVSVHVRNETQQQPRQPSNTALSSQPK